MIVLKAILCALALLGLVLGGFLLFASKFRFETIHIIGFLVALLIVSFSFYVFWTGVDLKSKIDSRVGVTSEISATLPDASFAKYLVSLAGTLYVSQQYNAASELREWGTWGAIVTSLVFLLFMIFVRPPKVSCTGTDGGEDFDAYAGFKDDELDYL